MTTKTVVLLGWFDTKGEAYRWLNNRIASDGVSTLLVDMSVAGEPTLQAGIPSSEVAHAAGAELQSLRAAGDRGDAVATMTRGARTLFRRLSDKGRVDGRVVGLPRCMCPSP